MSRRKVRIVAVAAIVGGFIATGAAHSFAAAPLPSASSDAQHGQASALGVPGLATVSESKSGYGAPSWSAVSVADTPVLGVTPAGWTGPAAPAGGLIDQINGALCQPTSGPLVQYGYYTCVQVLSGSGSGTAQGGIAGVLVTKTDFSQGASIGVLPSIAGSNCGFGRAALVSIATFGPDGTKQNNIGEADSVSNC